MGRKARVLDQDAWFLGKDGQQQYPINYGYVISYALLSLLHGNGFNKDDALAKLAELKDAIENEKIIHETSFLDVFVLNDGWGLVVVDQTGGIYPLVLYSAKRAKADADERKTAFALSLDNVMKKFDSIYDYFKGNTPDSWTKEFQEGLFAIADFHYQP